MDVKKVTECIDYIKKSMEKKTQADPEQSAHSDGDAKLENSFAVLHEAMMRLAASSHVMLPQPKPRLKLSSDTVRALRSLLAVIRSMEKDIEHSPQQKAELEEAVFRAVSAMDPTRTVKSNAGDSEPNAEEATSARACWHFRQFMGKRVNYNEQENKDTEDLVGVNYGDGGEDDEGDEEDDEDGEEHSEGVEEEE